MHYKNILLYTFITVLIAFTHISCSDNSTGANESEAVINGSVEDETSQSKVESSAQSVEGVTVTAVRVTSDGSFETIDGTETQTNAAGEFSMSVDVEQATRIAVMADKEGEQWMGYLSSSIENGSSYTLKPINSESTAETQVFAEIVSDGVADMVKKSDTEIIVHGNTANEIRSSNIAIAEIAAGLANAAEARAEYYTESAGENGDEMLDQALSLTAEALFQFESAVASSTSQEEKDAAFDVLLFSTVEAYTESGLDSSTTAKLTHMQSTALQNSFTSVSSEIENSVRASTCMLGAIAVDNAVQGKAEASGFSEATITAIADAGTNLRNEIKAGSGTASEITAAFEVYHDEVESAIENDSSTEASVIVTIDAEINELNGAKAVFESALAGVINALELTDIYFNFTTSVYGSVESKSDMIGDVDTEALADIMVLINLYT